MKQSDLEGVERFLERWQGSSGNERANYQLFFTDIAVAKAVRTSCLNALKGFATLECPKLNGGCYNFCYCRSSLD
jgi:hypothetical protein